MDQDQRSLPGSVPSRTAKQHYEQIMQTHNIHCKYLLRLKVTTNHCKYDKVNVPVKMFLLKYGKLVRHY